VRPTSMIDGIASTFPPINLDTGRRTEATVRTAVKYVYGNASVKASGC
jgi:hypothetical protein